MKRRKKKGIFFKFNFYLCILDKILFIVDQTLHILKKDRKIYLRSDSTGFRANSTFVDKTLFFR